MPSNVMMKVNRYTLVFSSLLMELVELRKCSMQYPPTAWDDSHFGSNAFCVIPYWLAKGTQEQQQHTKEEVSHVQMTL